MEQFLGGIGIGIVLGVMGRRAYLEWGEYRRDEWVRRMMRKGQ